MADQGHVDELRRACERVNEYRGNREELIRRPEWGELTFETIEQDILSLFWFVEEILRLPVELLPDNLLLAETQHLNRARDILNDIDNFTISRKDAASSRQNIAQSLKSEVESVMQSIGLWVPLLKIRSGEIETWTAKLEAYSEEADHTLSDFNKYVVEGRSRIESAVEAARAAAGESGAAEFTQEFETEANNAKERSRYWLWPTGLFGAAALVVCLFLAFHQLDDTWSNVGEAFYRLGGRIAAVSILFFAAIWSGRIALANMHQATINRHRAVGLKTLQAFRQSVEDAGAKDAVALEAARSVFANVSSGYIGKQTSEENGGTRFVEIIKNTNARVGGVD